MEILYLLEKLRVPGLNEFMLAVTQLGDETAFLVMALIFFWCVDKRRGYFIMAVGFVGTIANQFMKLLFRVPRPWERDPNFTILEEAREGAGGYSFPSGHSQTSVGTFGAIFATEKRRWLRAVCIAVMVLVPFSRMYVGVHTLSDVLVGSGMALALIGLLRPLVYSEDEKGMKWLLAGMLALAVGFLLYVELYPFPADFSTHNLESGHKNAYTLLGCTIGVAIVYVADRKWLRFPVEAVWCVQIIKAVLGLALVLAVKEGLRSPLEAVLPVLTARAVRYFLIVMVAGVLWPMTFRWFSKLGRK